MSERHEPSKPFEWEFIQAIDYCRRLYIESARDPSLIKPFMDSVKILRIFIPQPYRNRVPSTINLKKLYGDPLEQVKGGRKILREKAFEIFSKIIDVAFEIGLISEVRGIVLPTTRTSEEVFEEEGPLKLPEQLSNILKGDEDG